MGINRPLGLALSGGGFRATAFHLGVLKRLRELGLLAQVDALSTVSGGSIAGAYWVYWQALQGDTIVDASEWDRFERSLIHAMRSGLREWIWFRGFVVPSLLLGVGAGMVAILLGLSSVTSMIELAALVLTGAYLHWHARASNILQARYDQLLFNGCKLHDLSSIPHPADESGVLRLIVKENLDRWRPHIFMNATGLETGAHIVFPNIVDFGQRDGGISGVIRQKVQGLLISLRTTASEPLHHFFDKVYWRNLYRFRPGEMALADQNTLVASAVTASSAFPGVFKPHKVAVVRAQRPGDNAPPPHVGLMRIPVSEYSWAVDGGVFDNQGFQLLLDFDFRSILVCDAAAALPAMPRPSTWQVFPPGRGVVFRVQSIIYERVRNLGFRRLADRFRLASETRTREEPYKVAREDKPVFDAYAYVELMPRDEFQWDPQLPRLPDVLIPLVARIRTDLDRFAPIEISALMYHGYTSIDHCLLAYSKNWIASGATPLNFQSPDEEVSINWADLSQNALRRHARHLAASRFRLGILRAIWRWYLAYVS